MGDETFVILRTESVARTPEGLLCYGRTMTVGELIEMLQQFDPEYYVAIDENPTWLYGSITPESISLY